MSELSDEEAAERFANIVAGDKLQSDPKFQKLIAETGNAVSKCFGRMQELGFADIDAFVVHIICGQGHVHPVYRVTRASEEELHGD